MIKVESQSTWEKKGILINNVKQLHGPLINDKIRHTKFVGITSKYVRGRMELVAMVAHHQEVAVFFPFKISTGIWKSTEG